MHCKIYFTIIVGAKTPFLLVNMAEISNALGIDKYILVNVNQWGYIPIPPGEYITVPVQARIFALWRITQIGTEARITEKEMIEYIIIIACIASIPIATLNLFCYEIIKSRDPIKQRIKITIYGLLILAQITALILLLYN